MIEDLGMEFVKGESGEMSGVIFRVLSPSEDLLLWCEHAHHGKQVALDLHFFAIAGSLPKSSSAVSEPRTTTLAPRCDSQR